MKFSLVTIVTEQFEQMCAFYRQVLQVEPQIYRGNFAEFLTQAGTLALWRQSEYETFGIGTLRGAANQSVLIEFEVADADAKYSTLKEMKITIVQGLTTQPWGHRAFYIQDPDGNIINFYNLVAETR